MHKEAEVPKEATTVPQVENVVVEQKKPDVAKTAEEEQAKPKVAEAEAEKARPSFQKPVPVARTKPSPGSLAKTVPGTPTAPPKATGAKDTVKPAENSSFYGFLKRA